MSELLTVLLYIWSNPTYSNKVSTSQVGFFSYFNKKSEIIG